MTNMEKSVGAETPPLQLGYTWRPGVHHCEGGVGPDHTDLLKALDPWVTKGMAPATLTAEKLDANGAVTRTLPLCRYPQYPKWPMMLRQ
jgi:Tannase and feruloyl esterase